MRILNGTTVKGLGAATQTVALQMEHFRRWFPEVAECQPGTINVQLEEALRVQNPDFTTEKIPWHPSHRRGDGERFSFLRVGFEIPTGEGPVPAWIYIPHGSPHRYNLFQIEIMAHPIERVRYGMPCRIHIEKEHRNYPLVVV